jgi:hypothetical protein
LVSSSLLVHQTEQVLNFLIKNSKVYIWEEPSESNEIGKEWIKKSTIVDSTKSVDDIKFAPPQFYFATHFLVWDCCWLLVQKMDISEFMKQ